jgi:hypothetical protein
MEGTSLATDQAFDFSRVRNSPTDLQTLGQYSGSYHTRYTWKKASISNASKRIQEAVRDVCLTGLVE